jgi:glycosyltransferase involved in cell wall biosynthesis
MRLAFIVSHPIQYYVPIYRELAKLVRQRTTGDSAPISALKVFYTWRDAGPARDEKFGKEFAWDIPLMEGYDFEVVPNTSPDPGTHHRKGLINPDLVARVIAWKPDAVHITGYNYVSHGQAIKELSKAGIPVIFRGDSHLLDGLGSWWKWQLKKYFVSRIYRWPSAFTYVGHNNRDYFRAFGVPEWKLFPVPHTIEVGRFAEPNEELESKALKWRRELGVPDDHFVFLYAAKLEPRKRPMELLEAFLCADLPKTTLLFVGSGELEEALRARVNTGHGLTRIKGRISPGGCADRTGKKCSSPGTPGSRKGLSEKADDCSLSSANSAGNVRFLPFQNQSAMPVVYRLGDALVLPSGYGETWGLAVNEAQACGRPSLVSDCVGCARDIIREEENGMIFRTDDWEHCVVKMRRMLELDWRSKREAIRAEAWEFDTARGVEALISGLRKIELQPSKVNRKRSRR